MRPYPTREINDANCPACERFIGPVVTCPYCGCQSRRAVTLRSLRFAAVVVSFVGIALLYASAVLRDLPITAIADISAESNFAYLKTSGMAVEQPRIRREAGRVSYLSFKIADGAESIIVSASDRYAAELTESGLLPEKGDRVTVTGSIRVAGSGRKRLYIEVPGTLSVTAAGQQH